MRSGQRGNHPIRHVFHHDEDRDRDHQSRVRHVQKVHSVRHDHRTFLSDHGAGRGGGCGEVQLGEWEVLGRARAGQTLRRLRGRDDLGEEVVAVAGEHHEDLWDDHGEAVVHVDGDADHEVDHGVRSLQIRVAGREDRVHGEGLVTLVVRGARDDRGLHGLVVAAVVGGEDHHVCHDEASVPMDRNSSGPRKGRQPDVGRAREQENLGMRDR